MEQQEQDEDSTDEEPPRKRARRPTSEIWKYFTRQEEYCTCNICTEDLQTFHTTTLWRHIHNHPKQDVVNFLNQSQSKISITVRVLEWIVKSNIVLNSINNDEFKAMFDQPIPSRNTFKRLLEESFCLQKAKIKKELQDNSSKISFTTDLWSSNFKDFIGITAHFVDATFVLHHRVICLTQIFSHKGKDVADAFAACLEDWGVIDKIG